MAFALIGIESAVVASEMGVTKSLLAENKDDIINILWIVFAANIATILSIIGNYQLFIRWKRTKNYIIETDTLFNTG